VGRGLNPWSGREGVGASVRALPAGLGAEASERAGRRIAIALFSEVRVFHRPHPSPKTYKSAVAPAFCGFAGKRGIDRIVSAPDAMQFEQQVQRGRPAVAQAAAM